MRFKERVYRASSAEQALDTKGVGTQRRVGKPIPRRENEVCSSRLEGKRKREGKHSNNMTIKERAVFQNMNREQHAQRELKRSGRRRWLRQQYMPPPKLNFSLSSMQPSKPISIDPVESVNSSRQEKFSFHSYKQPYNTTRYYYDSIDLYTRTQQSYTKK